MITGQRVVDAARQWVGTPFHHQGRAQGAGVDCIGLVIGVSRELGILPAGFDYHGYGRDPGNGVMLREVSRHCRPVSLEQLSPGCLLLMRWFQEPQHVAIYAGWSAEHQGEYVVHAFASARGVVAHRYDQKWRKRTLHAFRLPGVIYG